MKLWTVYTHKSPSGKVKADVAKAINATTSNICRALKTGIKVKGYTLSYRKEEIK